MVEPDSGLRTSDRPELVLGIVSTLGVDLDPICESVSEALDSTVRYSTKIVRISDFIDQIYRGEDSADPEDRDRLRRLMDGGDRLRREAGEEAICAMLGVLGIQEVRERETGSVDESRADGATIIRQLKHPAEIQLLREIYGSRFVVIGVSDDPEKREKTLRERLSSPIGGIEDSSRAAAEALELIQRDDNDDNFKHGQHVRDAFALCDVYLSASDLQALRSEVQRLVSLLFGDPFITPSRDEMGVWHAFAAKHRSNASGRQVGAVITDSDGEILVAGCNDVPSPGGGQNWDGDSPDFRDYTLGYESNDLYKYKVTEELFGVLKTSGWLSDRLDDLGIGALVDRALKGDDGTPPIFKGRRIASLLEFGRIMHAEMAALMTAARRGTPVRGATLYTTTYPCHECMRLIIGAGVARVVYVDPYPKSLVTELFQKQLNESSPRIVLEPFLGISPKLVRRVFDQGDFGRTRGHRGKFNPWDGKRAAFKGEVTRYVDSTLLKEAGIAQMLIETYLPRIESYNASVEGETSASGGMHDQSTSAPVRQDKPLSESSGTNSS